MLALCLYGGIRTFQTSIRMGTDESLVPLSVFFSICVKLIFPVLVYVITVLSVHFWMDIRWWFEINNGFADNVAEIVTSIDDRYQYIAQTDIYKAECYKHLYAVIVTSYIFIFLSSLPAIVPWSYHWYKTNYLSKESVSCSKTVFVYCAALIFLPVMALLTINEAWSLPDVYNAGESGLSDYDLTTDDGEFISNLLTLTILSLLHLIMFFVLLTELFFRAYNMLRSVLLRIL